MARAAGVAAVIGALVAAPLVGFAPAHPAASSGSPSAKVIVAPQGIAISSHAQQVRRKGIWRPRPGTSWQWQITGKVRMGLPVQMYDIDLFDAQTHKSTYRVKHFGKVRVPRGRNAGVIGRLHREGKVVICYLDTGAWEAYRPDAHLFPRSVLGRNVGWPRERWLDTRRSSWHKFRPLIKARLMLARRSGCDGVEPDVNNAFGNRTGFPHTKKDQVRWYLEVAKMAHQQRLSVGMKNGIETTTARLVRAFDWNLNEECNMYDECAPLEKFIRAGKAVFQVEYADEGASFASTCPADNRSNFDGLIKKLELGAWRQPCRGA